MDEGKFFKDNIVAVSKHVVIFNGTGNKPKVDNPPLDDVNVGKARSGNLPPYSKPDANLIMRLPNFIQRFFTKLESPRHYTMPLVSLSGDYKISGLVTISLVEGVTQPIVGNIDLDQLLIAFDGVYNANTPIEDQSITARPPLSSGSLSLDEFAIPLSSFTAGELVRYELSKVGNTITMSFGSETKQVTRVDWAPVEVSLLGKLSNFLHSIARHADFEITDDGDKIIDWAIDENFAETSVVVNTGTLGAAGNGTAVSITESELFTLHTETNPDEWRNDDDTVIIPIG